MQAKIDLALTEVREGWYFCGMKMQSLLATLAFLGSTLSGIAATGDPAPSLGDLRKVGTVYLATSCTKGVQDDFKAATALLHSFFYDEARRQFQKVAEKDPKCAM